MNPEPGAGFAGECADVCPGFRAIGEPRRARKSELLCGELDGRPVIAKRLVRPTAVWSWYLAREIAIYRAFAAGTPTCRVPALVTADEVRGVLVIERVLGDPLATLRRPHAVLAVPIVEGLIATRAQLAAWPGELRDLASPPNIRAQLRDRLLEDPTAPLDWIRDGVARCARRGLFEPEIAARIDDALTAHAPIAFGHGDMLLRNVVAGVLVDWECAGTHVHDWDLALLWTQLAGDARSVIDRAIGDGPRLRAFHGLVAFAFARELRFLEAFPKPSRATAGRLHAELAVVVAQI